MRGERKRRAEEEERIRSTGPPCSARARLRKGESKTTTHTGVHRARNNRPLSFSITVGAPSTRRRRMTALAHA